MLKGIRYLFFRKNSIKKILLDSALVILISVFVFCILPRNITFFDLASAHTTLVQKAIHTGIALLSILLFRILMMVYKQPWNLTKTLNFLYIIVADVMAGIVYYVITEFVVGSVYPFMLTLILFALIDIVTLFVRLLYKGLIEDFVSMVHKNEK
jgi:FlaA1/EpsC-like NDP-sugar epimerase